MLSDPPGTLGPLQTKDPTEGIHTKNAAGQRFLLHSGTMGLDADGKTH